MKIYPRTRAIQRYIVLDLHKEYILAGGMNASQEWILPPRKLEMSRFEEWAKRHLCESDAVVIETTTNVWDIYDKVQALVGHAVVAHERSWNFNWCCYLDARWILVWDKDPESVCTTHSPKIHAPI